MTSRTRFALLLSALIFAAIHQLSARTWTSSGGDTVEAEYVSSRSGYVELKTDAGKRFRIHVSNLSQADRDYVSKRLSQGIGRPPAPGPKPKIVAGDPAFVAKMKPGGVIKRNAAGETGISYNIYTPGNFDTNSIPPIVIAFSPGGSGMQMVNAMKQSAEKAGWILVGVDKLRNNMKDDALSDKMEDEVLDDIFKNVPHNSARIYMAGFSGGAMRAYIISSRRKEPFAGIIAYGGWLGGNDADRDYCKNMAVAIVNGEKDRNANAWIDKDRSKLRRRKCEVEVFEHEGGHQIAPPSVTSEAIAWMEEEWQKR